MSMELGRGGGEWFDLSISAWCDILELAECYGWRPTGTAPPPEWSESTWCGTYYSNEYQSVDADDAAAIAAALDRFLAGEPPVANPSPDRGRNKLRSIAGVLARHMDAEMHDPGWSPAGNWLREDDGQQCLREFVDFCRRGSFWIC
jgi:hypothetical protein